MYTYIDLFNCGVIIITTLNILPQSLFKKNKKYIENEGRIVYKAPQQKKKKKRKPPNDYLVLRLCQKYSATHED